ncbi:hypothetical protein [Bradyrhizobium sp. USDA 4508]
MQYLYFSRAGVLDEMGEKKRALQDTDNGLSRIQDPRSDDQLGMNAALLLLKGRIEWQVEKLDEAASDIQRGLSFVKPDVPPNSLMRWASSRKPIYRGVLFLVRYDQGDWKSADDLVNDDTFLNDQAAIRAWLTKRRLFGLSSARTWLSTYIKNRDEDDVDESMKDVLDAILADRSEEEITRSLSTLQNGTKETTTASLFVAGSLKAIEENRAEAIELLNQCVSVGDFNIAEYRSAKFELKRLEGNSQK